MTRPLPGGVADSGAADPRLAAALAAWQVSTGASPTASASNPLGPATRAPATTSIADLLVALTGARVFAAVTATSTREHIAPGTALRAESTADMALVTLELPVPGGRPERALPVFSDLTALAAFRADARPVPVSGADVASAALEQGATTLLLDLRVQVSGEELAALAAGYLPVTGTGLSVRRDEQPEWAPPGDVAPGLLTALGGALRDEPVDDARLVRGDDGLVVLVVPRSGSGGQQLSSPQGQAALAQRLVARLGEALPSEGLDLAVTARRTGPAVGLVVPLEAAARGASRRRWFRPAR